MKIIEEFYIYQFNTVLVFVPHGETEFTPINSISLDKENDIIGFLKEITDIKGYKIEKSQKWDGLYNGVTLWYSADYVWILMVYEEKVILLKRKWQEPNKGEFEGSYKGSTGEFIRTDGLIDVNFLFDYMINAGREHFEGGKYVPSGPEAKEWLEKNKNDFALAVNRFGNNKLALKFVKELYEEGAEFVEVKVVIVQDDDSEYADTLVIVLPEDVGKRKKIVELCNEEAINEGFSPVKDEGQATVTLWWD